MKKTRSKKSRDTVSSIAARHPIEVFLGERTSDEENQETLVFVSKCRNAGKKASLALAFLQ
jgi:hypothetical protein